jgi:predicted TIM-barrel fold metal-dependent hydrolase
MFRWTRAGTQLRMMTQQPSIPSRYSGVRYSVPPLACDCHMHVFGPPDRYPSAAVRSYTPRQASLDSWWKVARTLGLQRLVVVQPSAYGTDNRCTIDALRELGPLGRGIAQIDTSTTHNMLSDLHTAGIRGVRINAKSAGMRDVDVLRALITDTGRQIEPFGWHVQLHAELALLGEIADSVRQSPVPIVLDHMGGAKAGDHRATLRPLLGLLASGRCWVKLSGAYRVSLQKSGFDDTTPIAKALVRANADQVIWGTDWPHTATHSGKSQPDAQPIEFRSVDDIALLDCLAEAAGNEQTFERILVTNPARLYGF